MLSFLNCKVPYFLMGLYRYRKTKYKENIIAMMQEEYSTSTDAQALLEALDCLFRHINRQIYCQNRRRATLGHGRGRLLRSLPKKRA